MAAERMVVSDEVSEADYDPQLQTLQALGALALLLGTMGMVMLPFGLERFHAGAIAGDARVNFYAYHLESTSPSALFLFFSSLLGSGLSLALALGGWGCLRLHWWARPLMLVWAITSLILGAIGAVFCIRWLLPPWRDQFPQVQGVIDMLAVLGGWGIGTALAAVMLYLLLQPHVRDFFAHKRLANNTSHRGPG